MNVSARHVHPTLALFNRYRALFPLTLTPDYSEDAYWRAAQLNNFLRGFRDAFQSPLHQQALANDGQERSPSRQAVCHAIEKMRKACDSEG